MATRGAPAGNKNATKNKAFREELHKALAQDAKRLRRVVEALLSKAEDGDLTAIKEVADRLEGRPAQSVAVGNEPGEEFVTRIVREIVRVND